MRVHKRPLVSKAEINEAEHEKAKESNTATQSKAKVLEILVGGHVAWDDGLQGQSMCVALCWWCIEKH